MPELGPEAIALLVVSAFLAGTVDAVVGGGGLIQLPALMVAFPGAAPVQLLATNKLGSIAGTSMSSITYYRRVRPDLRTAARGWRSRPSPVRRWAPWSRSTFRGRRSTRSCWSH